MKISIIIPIYNAEKYLSRCLDSILTLKRIDWECILIDDGSTDRSWDIICQYIDKSDRFICRHKENGGVSSARNMRLKICSGEIIMFVDPDDYLFPEADQLLYQAVTQYADYDMVLFRWADIYPDGTRKAVEIPITDFRDHNDWIKKTVLFTSTMSTCWSRLFKHCIIAEHNIQFDTSMRVAEDGNFVAAYLEYCHMITIAGDRPAYAYCQNESSAVRKFCRKDIFDELRARERMLGMVENRNVFLSQLEKKKMNSLSFQIVNRYAYKCAECCSKQEFHNIMKHLFKNKKVSEIIYNCDNRTDTMKQRLVKFLFRSKLFGCYWYITAVMRYMKKLRKKENQYENINHNPNIQC